MQDVYSINTVLCMYQIHNVQEKRWLSCFTFFKQMIWDTTKECDLLEKYQKNYTPTLHLK